MIDCSLRASDSFLFVTTTSFRSGVSQPLRGDVFFTGENSFSGVNRTRVLLTIAHVPEDDCPSKFRVYSHTEPLRVAAARIDRRSMQSLGKARCAARFWLEQVHHRRHASGQVRGAIVKVSRVILTRVVSNNLKRLMHVQVDGPLLGDNWRA